MKRLITAAVFIVGLAAALLLTITPAGGMFRISRHMRQLARSPDHREIVLACQALLRSSPEDRMLFSRDPALPRLIRAQNPTYVAVYPSRQWVLIECGGGFFHYGYIVERVSSGDGQWRLVLESENEEDNKELLRL